MFVRSIDFNKLDDYDAIQALRSMYESLRSVYDSGEGTFFLTDTVCYSDFHYIGVDEESVSLDTEVFM